MTNTTAEINAFLENSRKYAEPALRLHALSARTAERFARYGYDLAGDFLNFGLAALQATTETRDLPTLVQKQTELVHSHVEKSTQRSQDLVKLATEAQAEATQWFEQTATEYAARGSKAA